MMATPNKASDSGPQDPKDTRDWRDWIYEARCQAQEAERLDDDDLRIERLRRQHQIELAIDALKCALEVL